MDLIDKLPYFYDNGVTRPIIEAEQEERDILIQEVADTLAQCFVLTATWGLDYWEDLLLIPHDKQKSYEERRSIIYSRMRSTRTTTVDVVRQIALSFFESENVTITEENENYIFHIEFENANFDASDLNDLCKTIEIYKPAHLNYSFTFATKGTVIINSSQRTAYSVLPICNVTKVGTWWRMYAEGVGHQGSVIQARTYDGYSKLPICGVYKNVIKMTKDNFNNQSDTNNIVGSAVVGTAIVE